jgi:lysozyme
MLHQGDHGFLVRRVQRYLNELGAKLDVTGDYDSLTAAAVRQWKKRRNMPNGDNGDLASSEFIRLATEAWRHRIRHPDKTPDPPIRGEGIDVSNHQGGVDYASVKKSGRVFVIAKATEGSTFKDGYYEVNARTARHAGLVFGAYHFAHADSISGARNQVDAFIQFADPQPGDLVPAIDWETNPIDGKVPSLRVIEAMATRVHELVDAYPLIYSYPALLAGQRIPSASILAKCPLWYANYSNHPVPAPWKTAALTQYSSGGSCPGVKGRCDVDRADADLNGLLLS